MVSTAQNVAAASDPGRILLVDDEPNICRALQRLLRRDGYEMIVASTTAEALSAVHEQSIDVVISDQRMPDMKGTELLEEVRRIRPETVRIILSGYSDINDIVAAMNSGAINKFLTKPWDDGLLRADVREAWERARLLRDLRRSTLHDPSTGLPTTEYLQSIYTSVRTKSCRGGRCPALYHIGLGQAETIRSGYGADAVERLMQHTAKRLERALGASGKLARHGYGFLYTTDVLQATDRLDAMYDRLAFIEQTRIAIADDFEMSPALVIGCAVDNGCEKDFRQLVDEAETAAGRADATMRMKLKVFEPEMQARLQRSLKLEFELRDAIAAGHIVPYFQPQVDLKTGRIRAFEALARWRHPEFGFISPAEFVPIAERTGLIREMGEAILSQSLSVFSNWMQTASHLHEISINVSPLQLGKPGFAQRVAELIAENKVPPRKVVLEVTESAATSGIDGVDEVLEALSTIGVQLALDDFGTGHANITAVASLPMNKVKLDRSLIPRDIDDARAYRMLENLVRFNRDLGFSLIAEGVETAEQLYAVESAGCDCVQGFFFSPPVAEDGALSLLTESFKVDDQ
jgi:EAL domain-containing protein (putative c-di-GMP-specific phosphodiesterase class I)/PleD family two-component response regulator